MTRMILKITMGGLIAAGLVAYAQEPKEQQPAKQGQPATEGQVPAQSQSAEQVFATLDANHDGKLSQEEFGKLFRDAKVSDIQAEFGRWDKNSDKNLTMDEFKAGYPQK